MPRKSPPEAPQPEASRGFGRTLRRVLLGVYLAALFLSHLFRALVPPEPQPVRPSVDVPVIQAQGKGWIRGDERVRVSYLEWVPETPDAAERPTVLLVHGSPGDAGNFEQLGPLLAEHHRVVAVDLPGFGGSTLEVPDYSIRAHAEYVVDLLDALDIRTVHAVGFSMGGGVVFHLEEIAPERVTSVVLLAAIGVQELEMLGEYHLNHALHGLQLGGLWFLREAVPHFGVLDRGFLTHTYARNFFDTDQRPLRALLERFEPPMLILHGDGDVLVPYAAAVEHHRIVPQSELVTWQANHFMVFTRPGELATPLLDFVQRVEAGTALRRADATPERLAAAEDPAGFRPAPLMGFALILTLFLLALATLASEDLACIAAGLLVARGSLSLVAASTACGLGIFFGDLALYFAGRFGRRGFHRAPLRWIVNPKDLERSQHWFARRGALVILLSRFLPGTRLPTYVAAGVLRMPVLWFSINLLIPVALWTPFLVGLSSLLGESLFAAFGSFQRYALPGFILFLVTIWLVLGLGRSLLTWAGRRKFRGRLLRLRHWEFWSPFVFYPPIVLHVLYLGLRHRSPTLFTAANPGIPAGGGFVGESKSTILSGLDPSWVARYQALSADLTAAESTEAVAAFQKEHGLDFPLVLKPDQGERGSGVTIARSEADVEAYFAEASGTSIVQEYIPGPELGVFYVRLPGEERGRIFSVTRKVLPYVVADGRSNVEHLVLADPRAIALADLYLDRLGNRLNEVPPEGETIPLAQLGTHCRGAIFLDGADLTTPALEAAIDKLAHSFEGFYFGRFDLRAPSLEAFAEGRDFRVLELNGVTSEATHIYDPKNSLWEAYRVLREQWDLAFEIGRRNRELGERVLSVREVFGLLVARRGG